MNRTELLKYLGHVKDLEVTKYTQEVLIEMLTRKYNSLGRKRNIKEEKRTAYSWSYYYSGVIAIICIVVFIIGAILFYKPIWELSRDVFIAPSGDYYYGKSVSERKFETMIISAGIGALLSLITLVIIKISEKINKDKRQKVLDKESSRKYQTDLKKDNNRVKYELQMKRNLKEQIELIKAQKVKTEQELKKYYSLNIIRDKKKYRGLIPVTSFYEYFEDGRCKNMGDAYNIYSTESRLDEIITEVYNIHKKLDQIKDNQEVLYNELCRTNSTLSKVEAANNKMMNSFGAISENMEVTAYNAKSAAINSQAIEDFLIFKELWK